MKSKRGVKRIAGLFCTIALLGVRIPAWGQGIANDAFNPNVNGSIYATAVQADGKILIGGLFTFVGATARTNLTRLNVDGSVDLSFNPGRAGDQGSPVQALAVQPDGRILVGGGFTTLGGQAQTNLGRLNANGSLDATFHPGPNNWVYVLAVQPD